ncbi:MAG: D-alanyl-D-alanine carboxypeptidase family protein [Pseudomonadota bacterium]
MTSFLRVRMICAVALVGLVASPAMAERYAAFVADVETGEVLHARKADAQRFPASLTKMMTLYMLFEAVESEQTRLDAPMSVSREAASRPASRLGLRAGEAITVEDAIRALIIRSANDVAVVVAEHLAVDETAFAEAMTERARSLGLEQTTFRNASGLPDRAQHTTARDMARLGYALRRDFPDYYSYFSETGFAWNGRRFEGHNTLVGRVDGVDGLKTGYIRASGFNIAVSAEREGRSLIAVVMGGASAAVRDAHAEELIEAAFSALEARAQGRMLASVQAPRLNPIREQEQMTAELLGLLRPVAMGSAESAPAAEVIIADNAPRRVSVDGAWMVQVGAFASEAAASARLESVADLAALHAPQLAESETATERVERNGRVLWRARFTGLAADSARHACAALSARGESCMALSPRT